MRLDQRLVMVNQSLTTRLAAERLAAIKKFLPVRDRVREKLQQRQQSQTDFSESSEQLFAPITTATKDVKTATLAAIPALIAAAAPAVAKAVALGAVGAAAGMALKKATGRGYKKNERV